MQTACLNRGPRISQEPCPCGALVDVHHCNLHNQSCVPTVYNWEQILEYRVRDFPQSPDGTRYTAKDHGRLVQICEKCIQKTTA